MIPPPFESGSSLYGGLKPRIKKLSVRKRLPILVSQTIKTST